MVASSQNGVVHNWPLCVKVRGTKMLGDLDALNTLKELNLRCKPYLLSKSAPATMRPLEEPICADQLDQLYPAECFFIEFLDCELQEVHCERIRLGEKRWSMNARIPHAVVRSSSDLWDFGRMLAVHDIEATDTHGVRDRFMSVEAEVGEAEAAVTLPKQMFDDLVQRAAEATLKESQVSAAREELQKSYITIASLRATATAKEQAQRKQQLQQQQTSYAALHEDGTGQPSFRSGLWRAISRADAASPAAAGGEDKAGASTASPSRQNSEDTVGATASVASGDTVGSTPSQRAAYLPQLSLGIGTLGGMWKGRGPHQSSVEVDVGSSPMKLKDNSPSSRLTPDPLLAQAGVLSEPDPLPQQASDVTASPPLQPQPSPVITEAEELEKFRQKCAQLEKTLHTQALAQRRLETEFTHYQQQARDELRHALSTKGYSGAAPAPVPGPWIPPAEPAAAPAPRQTSS